MKITVVPLREQRAVFFLLPIKRQRDEHCHLRKLAPRALVHTCLDFLI